MTAPAPTPRPRRRRLRRIAWTALLVLVVLPALIVVAILASLRSAGVRQAILGRISSMLASDYGLAITAKDFTPIWRHSGIELREVRVGAPGATPLATARRVIAVIDLGTLRDRPLVVRSLDADGLLVDLTAPIPKLPESTPEEAGAGPPVEIRRIVLRNGEVRGAALAKPAADWLRSWNARDIAASGSYRGGRLELNVERGKAILDRPGFGLQELRLAGRIGYEEKKPLRLDSLTVIGDGLRLSASGIVGLEEGSPTAARFDLNAQPRALAAGLPPRGQITASGDIALPEISGRLRIAAAEIPAEALRPYLDPKLYADLALGGTVADMKADATVGPGSWNRVAGKTELTWRRGNRRLTRAELRLSPGRSTDAIVGTVAADLLPGSPGRRFVQGTVRAASLQDLARATADGVRAEIRIPDVRAALAEIRSLWPRLVPAPPPGTPLQGSLSADARLSGLLTAPDAALDAMWLPQAGSLVRVEAKGKPSTWSGSAKVRMEALPLSMLGAVAPGLIGTVTGTADLSGSPRGYRTRIEAVTAAVSYPPQLQRLENATIAADGTLVFHPLSYRGTLSLDGTGLAALPKASSTARIATVRLAADGALRAEPFDWQGKVTLEGEGAEMEGTGRADRFAAVADGTLAGQPLLYDGSLSLDASGVEKPETARVDRLQLSAKGRGSADLRSLAAQARIDADHVALIGQDMEIRNLHLEAEADSREVRLSALSGELPEGRAFNASGRFVTDPLLAEADLDLRLVKPVDAVTAADLTVRLRDGLVEMNAPRLDTASGPGSLHARIPLEALRAVPQLASILESLPGEKARGPVSLSVAFPELDSQPLLAALGLKPRPERVRTGVSAELSLDLGAPANGSGEVRLSGLTVENPDGRVTAETPAVFRLAGGRLELAPVHLRIDGGSIQGAGVDVQGSADLARSWKPFADPIAAVVTRLSGEGNGAFDAAILNPYLQGGVAEGSLSFSAKASGTPDHLGAEVRASGPGASFAWPAAAVRVGDPRLAVDLRDGRWTIREGQMGVNGGKVSLAGGVSPDGGVDVEAQLAGVRYRLDYGIETLLSGRLALRQPAGEERSRLSGRVVVERGVLDRDLNLDREIFTLLFKPPEPPGTEESALSGIDLGLDVETDAGVRIKNNVGDLHASWRKLTVGGTLETPVIRGRIDIDPGGLFCAYGQTVRIDRGSLVFTGDPFTDPQIDLATTSSLQDPTMTQLCGDSSLDLLARRPEDDGGKGPGTEAVLAAGLTGYYGARFVQRLGESVGLRGFSVRPELVFEDDPSARLTIGRDLSNSVSVAFSADLRNAERQAYLLDVHEVRSLPGLRLAGFTNDAGNEGASLQQAFAFGGGEVRPAETQGPRLRRLVITAPKKGVSKRQLRRAVGLEKRQPMSEGAAFSIEVDAADFLRRKGYPNPRIAVAVKPVESRHGWVDVNVTVEPGPRVSYVFAGDRPPRGLRQEITSLYRTDFYEKSSVEEMWQATARAFRATGHLNPEVAIEVQREHEDPDSRRTVTIRTTAGQRQVLAELHFTGLPPQEERFVIAAFPSTLARAELAAGVPDADARLLATLRGLGYDQARITGRSVDTEGSALLVNVEPGPLRTVSAVEIAGVEGEERERLRGLLPLRAGDPLRADRVAGGERLLERDLQERGYADAEVRSSVVPAPDRRGEAAVVYRVVPGPLYRLAGVELTGARWSRQAPLRREADLAAGAPFTEAGVEEARNRLFATGVFSRVDAAVDKGNPGETRVSFSLAERPRFRLGYGVRWESEAGTAAVLDFVDENFLGRAVTLGLRSLYQSDDRSGRLYLDTGGVLGTRVSLESYAEERRRLFPDDNLVEDRREAALQASRPLGESSTARLYARYRTTHLYEMEPDPFFPFDLEIRLPYVGLQLLHDTRDDRIDPRSGLFTSLDLSGSGTFLGSDFKYARLFAQAATFRHVSLASRPWLWAQAVRLGLAHPFAGQELIRDERFFAGGPFSVRGYAVESLGPREILGDLDRALGGEALFVINEEMRFALPWDLTGLAFFDAGQVWARPGDADFDLAKSLGIGLRARSPVGLLRFDAAYPLDRRPGEASYKLYLGFGNTF